MRKTERERKAPFILTENRPLQRVVRQHADVARREMTENQPADVADGRKTGLPTWQGQLARRLGSCTFLALFRRQRENKEEEKKKHPPK